MEEWSPHLFSEVPSCLTQFLGALRQCIEVWHAVSAPFLDQRLIVLCFPQHSVFMHSHHIAHLDISLRNLLTDYNFRYAYIDYERSRRFDCMNNPRLSGIRGTEMPPETERGEPCDPYKVDIWALGVLILRACKVRFRYHHIDIA
jgi:serine/threonine protein kinase